MIMTWNSNPYWCPRNKEADTTPRRIGSTLATDCTPLLLSTKVSQNKLATIIARLREVVARRQRDSSFEFSFMIFLTKDYSCTIVKDNYMNVNYSYNWGISDVGDNYNWP